MGAEALVRWYKYGSIVSPYIFIPMCEANGSKSFFEAYLNTIIE